MAQYWVYLNNEVAGPYAVEKLIRLRGFSRQTLICIDDASGKPTNWISPAEIPELAHIFKAVDEQHALPTPAPAKIPKPAAARPLPRPAAAAAPVRLSPIEKKSYAWLWILSALVVAGASYFIWSVIAGRGEKIQEQTAVETLIEDERLPASSLYSSLRQYMQEKEIEPRWQLEKTQDGLYHATLSWYAPTSAANRPTLSLYAFEVNTQAQIVRGLNSAAITLLAEGFPAPAKAKAAPAPKKSSAESFAPALDSRRQALQNGDFSGVWDSFSQRKKAEMNKGGISRDGFIRLQNLTYKVDSAVQQDVLKTKQESETEMLALIKQTQANRQDIFIKQLWVFENGVWKLDDEEKRVTGQNPAVSAPNGQQLSAAPAPSAQAQSSPPAEVQPPTAPADPSAKPPPASLPGMSN